MAYIVLYRTDMSAQKRNRNKPRSATITQLQGRKRAWRLRFFEGGAWRTAHFFSRAEAEAAAADKGVDASLPDDFRVSGAERAFVAALRRLCEKKGFTLARAEEIALKAISAQLSGASVAWDDAVADFAEYCRARGLRDASVKGYLGHLRRANARARWKTVYEMTRQSVESVYLYARSPKHVKVALSAFCSWARNVARIIEEDPSKIPLRRLRDKETTVSVLTPKQARLTMERAPAELVPALALMAFAGVRPEELATDKKKDVLAWRDVDFAARKITIRGAVAKSRTVRVLNGLPANVWAWLEQTPQVERKGKVFPRSYSYFRKLKKKHALALPRDVLRHSFASYAYHALGAERAVEILGHVGGFGVFARHYKGVATPQDARAYFAILPPKAKSKNPRIRK